MIVDTLENIEIYKELSSDIYVGLQFLANAKEDIELGIYQINDNVILNKKEKTITLQKSGIGSQIYDFAHKNAAAYGFFVIIFAILSGFLAATLFRRY